MARQRIHNSRAGRGSGNSGASWISYSDMMAALLLVFVLILSVSLYQYFTMLETKTAELDRQQVQLDEQTLQLASQQVTLDFQTSQLLIVQTELDQQKLELEQAYIILGQNQAELQAARSALTGKEAELIILQDELAAKEMALNAAIQVLNQQQASLDAQADKIEDMVGVRSHIISDLSHALRSASLNASVDEDGNIVLDSAVPFQTNSSTIMPEGKAFLERFIPVYLEVLMRPEYADYLGQIIIEGHTDDVGTWEANMKLSQQRAYEVMMYVVSMYPEGSAERELLQKLLTSTGRSESDLIYTPWGTVDQDASRRVEFKFSLKDAEMLEEMRQLLEH